MYKVYLGDLLLPVTPSKIDLKYGNKNKTATLINSEEINVLNSMGLTEISFEAMLPNFEYPFAEYEDGFKDAGVMLEKIRNLKASKKPLIFKVIRRLHEEGRVLFYTDDFKAAVEDLSYTEDAKNGLDVTVKIKLKQYVDYAPVKFTDNGDGTADAEKEREISEEKKEEIPSEENPQSYTVQKGDSLWAICKRIYGDGGKWREIAELNGLSNPRLIYPGQVIKLA